MQSLLRRYLVTGRYEVAQGLRLLPLGLLFLITAAWRAEMFARWPSIGPAPRVWFIAGLVIAIAGSFPIRRCYWRRFGYERSRRRWRGALTLTGVSGVFLVAVALQPAAASVSLPAMVIGLALVHPALSSDGRRWHYLPLAAAWCLFACLPLVHVTVHVRDVGLDLLIGFSLIVSGLGDHWLLRRAFAASGEKSYVCSL